MLIKTLKWPFISMFIAGALHFTVEAIWPDLQSLLYDARSRARAVCIWNLGRIQHGS